MKKILFLLMLPIIAFSQNDYYYSVKQTSDSSFISTGVTTSLGTTSPRLLIRKVKFDFDNMDQSPGWYNTYNLETSSEGFCIIESNDGGYVATGTSYGFGGVAKIYVVKTDSQGSIIWEKVYGQSGFQEGLSIENTNDGGFIVAGYKERFSGGLSDDIYLLKLDANGDSTWAKQLTKQGMQRCYSVKQTSDGGYILGGMKQGFYTDFYIVKTNINGDTLWSKSYNNSSPNISLIPKEIHETSDGGFVLGGAAYILKTDSLGNTIWFRNYFPNNQGMCFASPPYGARWQSIVPTSDNGFVVCGRKGNASGGKVTYVMKIDNLGDTIWAKTHQFSNGCEDEGFSIQETFENNFIVSGRYIFAPYTSTTAYPPNLVLLNNNGNLYSPSTNTDIAVHSKNQAFKIYPNPTNENITISVNNFTGNIQTEVYDLIGNRLRTTNETTISLRNYSKGIYILKVAYGDKVEEVKVIKD